LEGHTKAVGSAVFSPNGTTILTASFDNTAKLWDAKTGKLLQNLEGHIKGVELADFSPDGTTIITASLDKTAKLWDAKSGKLIQNLKGHNEGLNSAAFCQDGTSIVTAADDFTAKVWNAKSGALLQNLEGHSQRVNSAAFSPDGTTLLTNSWDNTVKLWDTKSGALLQNLEGHTNGVNSAAFSQDGTSIVTASDDFTSKIWDAQTGKVLQNLVGHTKEVESAIFSSDGTSILTTASNIVKLWDVKTGKLLQNLKGHIKRDWMLQFTIGSVVYSPDGTSIVTTTDTTAKLWDAKSGKLLHNFVGHTKVVGSAVFSSDGTSIVTSGDITAKVWDVKSGKLLQNLEGHNKWVRSAVFNPDGTKILTASFDKTAKLWDAKSGKLLKNLKGHTEGIVSAVFSSDGTTLLTVSHAFSAKLWDVKSGKILQNFVHTYWGIAPVYSSDGTCILTTGDNTAKLWDAKSGKLLQNLEGHKNIVNSAVFSPKGKYVLTSDEDHKTFHWDVASGNPIYERIQLENNNWLVKLPNSPYYMCSKDASKMLHYVTPSLKVIGFEQLDPVYNRPDIVLDSIGKYFGNSDGGMIDEYRKSWEKRIDRLGLDKEKLGKGEIAVPNAEIEGADAIAYENKAGKLNIKVSANDPKYPLRRFNVFVNEVPLYGSTGISIAHLKKQAWDTTVRVPLSVGENKIQVSVMNELGLENFKYPTYVNYTPDKEIVAKTYYIGIGVNEFKDTEHNLKYCVKDVTDLAKSFVGANTEVKLFTDQQVTKENILALKDYLNKTGVNDKVIISCSSHGLLDDSLNFYLAMHDVDFNNPKARGLKYEALESLLDGIPARQKLLLLDACNSGENDKTEVLKQELQQKEKNMDSSQVLAARGVIIKLEEENKSNFKKMNELFVNVRNNTGSVIISAAGGQESALEAIEVDGKTIKNGAFTYSILECLKQNEGKELKVNALKQYAEKRVEEITNGKQKPTSRQETMEVDWGVR
jgi:WD40 repeat protein